jgi:hypothetical protein
METIEVEGLLLPTMFSDATPPEAVDAFRASMLGFHPAGFRAMVRDQAVRRFLQSPGAASSGR